MVLRSTIAETNVPKSHRSGSVPARFLTPRSASEASAHRDQIQLKGRKQAPKSLCSVCSCPPRAPGRVIELLLSHLRMRYTQLRELSCTLPHLPHSPPVIQYIFPHCATYHLANELCLDHAVPLGLHFAFCKWKNWLPVVDRGFIFLCQSK